MTMAGPIGVQDRRTEAATSPEPQEVRTHEEDNWDEPECDGRPRATDDKGLQGAWESIGCDPKVQFLIAGARFTVRFTDGAIYMGTFQINSFVFPRTMDLVLEEGPAPHRGKAVLCIYELDGDNLRVAAARPGATERPTLFSIEPHSGIFCPNFRRDGR
jgi:uncharacterized protein (TIGR03067 family)